MSALIASMLPLIFAVGVLVPGRSRTLSIAIAPWLPLVLLWPALVGGGCECSDLLLGLRLGVDPVTRPLLLLSALAWTAAGWFAAERVRAAPVLFWGGWLASLGGMALLLLARDIAGLYIGYAILSLASWLMVVHAQNRAAWRAGTVYLIMALVGEMAVFAGVAAIVSTVGNAELTALEAPAVLDAHWRWLLFAGYAVKMGVLGLHLWLPLAHPVAPVPASAILSGVIVKAGLVGWLRLLPPGSGMEAASGLLVVLGLITAFGGVALGLAQDRIKVVLAYSTISQMGLVLAAFGALFGTAQPLAAYAWLGVLVLHHGLNKASLFVACGCAPGRGVGRGIVLALPALALSGAPLTTGVLGKHGLKTIFHDAGLGEPWIVLLSLTSTATALLLWRFWRLARAETSEQSAHPAWFVLTAAALSVPWAWAAAGGLDVVYPLTHVAAAAWPLALAALLILIAGRLPALGRIRVPPGDLIVVVERIVATGLRAWKRIAPDPPDIAFRASGRPGHAMIRLTERYLRAVPVAGFLILVVGALMWLLVS